LRLPSKPSQIDREVATHCAKPVKPLASEGTDRLLGIRALLCRSNIGRWSCAVDSASELSWNLL